MNLSYSRSFEVQCPECGVDLKVEVWFTIDTIERPDLLQRCFDDSIHTFACSYGHPIRFGAPLLVIDRAQSRLLFSTVGDHSLETARKAAMSLLGKIREMTRIETIGLSDQIEIIPRSRLRMALNGKSEDDINRFESALNRLSQTDGLGDSRFREQCRQALDILDRDDDPSLWAGLKNDFASSVLMSSDDDIADEEVELAIESATEACSVFNRREYPGDWARAQHTLARAFCIRVQGDRTENIEKAISAAESALTVVNPQLTPERFAAIQMALGQAFKHRDAGDPQTNLSLAEQAFTTALQAVDPKDSPVAYATIQREIGNTMYDLAQAYLKQSDLPAARDAFADAVEVQRSVSHAGGIHPNPELARALGGLGKVHDLLADQQKARGYLAEAAAIYESLAASGVQKYEADLAFVLSDLGQSLSPRGTGNSSTDSENLSEARESSARAAAILRALIRRDPENTLYQSELAMALHHSAACELKLVGDNPDVDALQHYRDKTQEAIDIFHNLAGQDYDLHPSEIAMMLTNLGSVCKQLGDIGAACRAYTEATSALEYAKRQDSSFDLNLLVTSFMALGRLQLSMNEYSAARDNVENAVVCLRRLRQLKPGQYDGQLAGALSLLGQVRDSLGDEEGARECLESSAEIIQTRDTHDSSSDRPLDRAVALVDLARIQVKMKDLDGAMGNGREAMKLIMEHGDPTSRVDADLMATCLINLSNAVMAKGGYQVALNGLEQAIDIYRKLSHDDQKHLPKLALALTNLGIAQMSYGNVRSARVSLQESLIVRRIQADLNPELFATSVASTLVNLGVLEAGTGNSDLAVENYEEAIEVLSEASKLSPVAHAHELFACWNNLSNVYLPSSRRNSSSDYYKAHSALRNAVRYAELSRGRFVNIGQRRRLLSETVTAYQRLIRSCVELWKDNEKDAFLREAVEASEASRARMLTEALVDEELQPVDVPPKLVGEFLQVKRQLRESERLLFEEERGKGIDVGINYSQFTHVSSNSLPPGLVLTMRGLGEVGSVEDSTRRTERIIALKRDIDSLQGRYTELLEQVRKLDADYGWDAFSAPIGYEKILSLLPPDNTTAIVQFVLTDECGYAFVILRDFGRPVVLHDLSEDWLDELTQEWVALRRRTRMIGDWSLDQVIAKRSEWQEGATAMLKRLSTVVIEPILGTLPMRNVDRLILAPHGALHVFPIHACPLSNGRFLIDDFEIVYAPSLSVLHSCLIRKRTPSGGELVIENPTGDLPFAEVEGHCVHSHYSQATRLHGQNATRHRVLNELRTCRLLHYSGHGLFDNRDPLSSALVLEDRTRRSKWLSLREVICGLRMDCNFLCVLSGCETGLLIPDVMDEFVSLPLGFLSAGSKCVVSTLWEIDDLSTALLFDRFYAEYRTGRAPAAALQSAQLWLRDGIPTGRILKDEVVPALLKRVDDEVLRGVCLRLADDYAELFQHTPPFASLLHWAPFITVGLGYDL